MSRISDLRETNEAEGYFILYDIDSGYVNGNRHDYESVLHKFQTDSTGLVEFRDTVGADIHIRVSEIQQIRYVSSELAELIQEHNVELRTKGE